MSIQDDIFNVRDILKENHRVIRIPVDCKFAFERICEWIFDLEDERNYLKRQNGILTACCLSDYRILNTVEDRP